VTDGHLRFLDDQVLVAFFPAQHFQRHLLHFRQARKLHDLVAIELYFAGIQFGVFLENRQPRLQRQFRPDTDDLP